MGELRAGHAALVRQGRHFCPGFVAWIVRVPRVVDVRTVVAKAGVNDAVDAKMVRVVSLRGWNARLFGPRVRGHVVVPPVAQVTPEARAHAHENVPFVGDEGRVVAGLAWAGGHLGPFACGRVEPPQVVHGPVVVEPKPHPRDPIPHVADGVAAGLAWEVWQRGPGVRRRVVAVGGVGESVGGLACDEVAGAVHREPEGVVREVPVWQFRHRRPGLCVHGCGAQEHSKHAGPKAERVESHGAKVHWVNPRMVDEVHKVLDGKKPTRCAGFSLVRRDRDSNSGTKNIGHSLAGCCITTLPPLQRSRRASATGSQI